MNDTKNPLAARTKMGYALIAIGLGICGLAVMMNLLQPEGETTVRILAGMGITLAIIGAVNVLLYSLVGKDKSLAREVAMADGDERGVLIRLRAANRGFWVAMLMIFGALLWVSAATRGGASTLETDGLWLYLAACVVVPMLVFAGSQVYDQRRL